MFYLPRRQGYSWKSDACWRPHYLQQITQSKWYSYSSVSHDQCCLYTPVGILTAALLLLFARYNFQDFVGHSATIWASARSTIKSWSCMSCRTDVAVSWAPQDTPMMDSMKRVCTSMVRGWQQLTWVLLSMLSTPWSAGEVLKQVLGDFWYGHKLLPENRLK